MTNNYLQFNKKKKTEVLISAPAGFLPKVMERFGPYYILSSHCNLSVHIGQVLSLNQHITFLVRNCFCQLRNTAKLRTFVSIEMILHAFISSHLDYCNSLLTCLSN